jgi:hypothetical protein
MAHKKKYYKSIESYGHHWMLEIWQDTEQDILPMEIGPILQGLKLVLQGDQSDIDTPIVKTSLQMSFVDAPDLSEEKKCGYWEEFYTSSATEYLVKLYKDNQLEWSGYITPDSFEEELSYRGSVSILARDNLGYLKDFKFTLLSDNGLVSLETLLSEAQKIINFQMQISESNYFPKFSNNNGDLRQILFNVSAFRDKTWWDVIETALYSLGVTLRYIGRNSFFLAPIREQSKCGYSDYWDMSHKDVQFVSYGRREISPAAKSIVESVDFDIQDSLVTIYASDYQYGSSSELTFVETSEVAEIKEYAMPVFEFASQGAGISSSKANASRLLNPYIYKLNSTNIDKQQKAIYSDDVLLALSNTVDITSYEDEQTGNVTFGYQFRKVNPLVFSTKIQLAGSVEMKFTFGRPVVIYPDNTIGDFVESQFGDRLFLQSVGFRAVWEGKNGERKYLYHATLEGGWTNSDHGRVVSIPSGTTRRFTQPITISLPSLDVNGPGNLTIEFYGGFFPTTTNRNGMSHKGAYIRITDVDIMATPDTPVVLVENTKVTTAYNEKNNLLLNREPRFAPNPNLPLAPQQVSNNLMMSENDLLIGALNWAWSNNDYNQLSVLVHQQMLCYYARPMNMLSGELIGINGEIPDFSSLWLWNKKEHMLISGTLNILTGRMENVVLREFLRYDHMWETWVEVDDVEVDYLATSLQLKVHSNKTITSDDLKGLPLWMIGSVQSVSDGVYIVSLAVEANSSMKRVAIITIDTARVRVTQFAPGDYGLDYGEDYS